MYASGWSLQPSHKTLTTRARLSAHLLFFADRGCMFNGYPSRKGRLPSTESGCSAAFLAASLKLPPYTPATRGLRENSSPAVRAVEDRFYAEVLTRWVGAQLGAGVSFMVDRNGFGGLQVTDLVAYTALSARLARFVPNGAIFGLGL